MGFSVEKLVTLVFGDSEYEGAEVEVNIRLPLKLYQELDAIPATVTGLESLTPYYEFLLRWGLRRWNLENADGPIPMTVDGLALVPPDVLLTIVNSWRRAIWGLPLPLGERSDAGDTSEPKPDSTSQPSS